MCVVNRRSRAFFVCGQSLDDCKAGRLEERAAHSASGLMEHESTRKGPCRHFHMAMTYFQKAYMNIKMI